MKKLFLLIFVIHMLSTGISLAFTEMTPKTLEKKLQDKHNRQQVINLWQQQLSKIDIKEYNAREARLRMQKLTDGKKVPAHILEKGSYKYAEGNNAAYIVGENVFMRSQPNTDARIITKLNTKQTEYLTYLGEWKHPNTGSRWVCVKHSSREVGWIFGKYIKLVPNIIFQNIISLIKGKSPATDSVSKNVASKINTANIKIISTENHLNKTLKRYSIYGLIAWILSFLVTFICLDWKLNFHNILQFLFWSIIIVGGAVISYLILYYIIWKEIILPILRFIAIILGAFIVLVFFTRDGWIIPIIINNELNNRRNDS